MSIAFIIMPDISDETLRIMSFRKSTMSLLLTIDGKVYDLTAFQRFHPGGALVLEQFKDQDASSAFHEFHNDSVLVKYAKLVVGVSTMTAPTSLVPYSEPEYSGKHWYTPQHKAYQLKVRTFVEQELLPNVHYWDEAGTYPNSLHRRAYEAGIYASAWPIEYGGTPPDDGFDAYHDLILLDELGRCASGGVLWSCFFSFGIALPPILKTGSKFLKDKVARDVITGRKIMALAVTEPFGGSDVGNIRTTAVKLGDTYSVNGSKKFITSGLKADYYTVAVRTSHSDAGKRGISLLLIERDSPGVTVRRQKTQGWWTSNTAHIVFDNVKVPSTHLIGSENQGMKVVMENFNHERYALAVIAHRYCRVCLEDSIKFGRLRKTFGKRLVDHQVIRHKIAEMARRVEATQAWIESITARIAAGVSSAELGGTIALLKVHCTKELEFCAREASQILGGASFVRGGVGERIERIYREVRVSAIGGGSEEILTDLAMSRAQL